MMHGANLHGSIYFPMVLSRRLRLRLGVKWYGRKTPMGIAMFTETTKYEVLEEKILAGSGRSGTYNPPLPYLVVVDIPSERHTRMTDVEPCCDLRSE